MVKAKIRAAAILIEKDKILLIHRTQQGKQFWVLPGGGVEKNEKVKDAVVRELKEETSVDAAIIKLIYIHKYPGINHKHYYYLCKYVSGIPKLGDFNELQTMKNKDQTYEPVWVEIKKLPRMLLYPLEIRDWIIEDYENGFEDTPKTATLNT